MARPRVFVSSTYYDLKHIRASLDIFIESLGYDSILSEKGDIAYNPDHPLDHSCYREISTCDIFVLIIGGRYGSETSNTKEPNAPQKNFFERYESITKTEHEHAFKKNVPIYIIIEASVHSEYLTFRKNKKNTAIEYAHVDSVNIFYFIDAILSQPRNNPYNTFQRFADIEAWLREQWAGLFREFLNTRSEQKHLAALSEQVETLRQSNETLKHYLEFILKQDGKKESKEVIEKENKRLTSESLNRKIAKSYIYDLYMDFNPLGSIEDFTAKLISAGSLAEFLARCKIDFLYPPSHKNSLVALTELSLMRSEMGLAEWDASQSDL